MFYSLTNHPLVIITTDGDLSFMNPALDVNTESTFQNKPMAVNQTNSFSSPQTSQNRVYPPQKPSIHGAINLEVLT